MEKLDCHIWVTTPAVGTTFKDIIDKINEIIDNVNYIETELTRIHRDKPHPRDIHPYDLSNSKLRRR
jgi:hypothetical protein